MKYDYHIICNDFTRCPDNWGMRSEAATFHRIYYVYSGEAYCVYKEEVIQLLPGSLYVFPVMSPYTMWHNPDNPLKVLWFHVETDPPLAMELQQLKITQHTPLWYLLEALRSITGQPEYFQELVDGVGVFLHLLTKRLVMEPGSNKQMKEILSFIDQNISARDLSVDTLAQHIGMDRASFSRKFKKIFNLSPGQFIFEKKMNCAAMELSAGASVYQAACKAGYLDEKSFSRAFKRYTATTPSEYRKKRAILP